ncbi:MAG TPA: TadE family protein [Gryllotalpicola sp.]
MPGKSGRSAGLPDRPSLPDDSPPPDGPRRSAGRGLWDESGNAALEFLTAGVILLVPLVYLGLALSTIQGASLAVEGAAREAARTYVSAATDAAAQAAADRAVTVALADRRIDRRPGDLTLACDPGLPLCLEGGRSVTVTVRTEVVLPLVPPVFGVDRLVRVPIQATATAPVFRPGAPP